MLTPSLQDLRALVTPGQRQAIPVFREVIGDLDTPVSAFMKLRQGHHGFLLESVEGGERWARYSFIGLDPAFVIRARGRLCERVEEGRVVHSEERDDPLAYLQEAVEAWAPVKLPGLPRFIGGAVGWLAYDCVRWWERLAPEHRAGRDHAPDMVFAVPRSLVVFDNLKHRILLVQVLLTEPDADLDALYQQAEVRIEQLLARLLGPLPALPEPPVAAGPLRSNFAQPDFEASVERIQAFIRAGDCIQVVLSQSFALDYRGADFDLYRALRAVNPSPYMFFLDFPEQTVVGASPEVMVRVEDGEMLVAPIAGTRHRGATEAEDLALAEELLADPKERAEHVMLVDLGRNDLGRVAAPGTVQVHDLMHIQRFSHVMHIVSTVKARLAEGRDGYDAVRATFPAGTLSGAPKVRAMELIDALEPSPRGLYGGAVGYFGFDGNLDLCIAIRTAFKGPEGWRLQVGAGIVADSVPEAEHQETLNKAGGVLRALEVAGRFLYGRES